MYCKNCGKESGANQKFCTSCGTQFSSVAEDAPTNSPPISFAPKKFFEVRKAIPALIVIAFIGWGIYASLDDDAISTNNNAISNYESGNNQQAISQFQQASRDAVTDETKINTLKNLAYAYSSEGQIDLALSTFKEALALASVDSVDYYLISGEIAELEAKPNAALIAYNKAYAKDPNDYQVNNSLALFHIDIEDVHPQYVDYPKALGYAQKANQLNSGTISKKNLALAYYFNENYSQTISLLKSVDISSEPIYAYFLGLSYAQIDDSINAKIYLRQAIAGGIEVPQEVYDYLNQY